MEAQEIFGDVDELLSRRKQDLERDDTNCFAPKQIEDEFEPFILSEKYMTPKDDIIRETDVPERLQIVLLSYFFVSFWWLKENYFDLTIGYKVGDMIQGIVMAEMALVAAAAVGAEDGNGDGDEVGTVILGVMGTMSLDRQGGALAQGTTMVKDLRAGEAVEVGTDGAVVEMIMVGEIVVAVHGVATVVAALGVVVEMVVGAHGEMGEVVVIGVGQSSLRNWYPLGQMLVAGVEVVVGDGNKD